MATEWTNLREAKAAGEVGPACSTQSAEKPRTGGRGGAEQRLHGDTSSAHRSRKRMNTKLDRIAEKAKTDRKCRFTSLAHLLTPEFLMETWREMNHKGASGIDGETVKEFESELE